MLVKGRTSWAPLVATPGVGESVSESSFLLRRALTIRVDIAELECSHGSGWRLLNDVHFTRKSIAGHENVPRGQAAAAVHGMLMFGRLLSAREDFPTSKLSTSFTTSCPMTRSVAGVRPLSNAGSKKMIQEGVRAYRIQHHTRAGPTRRSGSFDRTEVARRRRPCQRPAHWNGRPDCGSVCRGHQHRTTARSCN